jgi:hypothetical protein
VAVLLAVVQSVSERSGNQPQRVERFQFKIRSNLMNCKTQNGVGGVLTGNSFDCARMMGTEGTAPVPE